MRAEEEPEGRTQVQGNGWELGGGREGWGLEGLHRPCPWGAETKVLMNLVKSDCPRLNWGMVWGGSEGEDAFSFGTG